MHRQPHRHATSRSGRRERRTQAFEERIARAAAGQRPALRRRGLTEIVGSDWRDSWAEDRPGTRLGCIVRTRLYGAVDARAWFVGQTVISRPVGDRWPVRDVVNRGQLFL